MKKYTLLLILFILFSFSSFAITTVDGSLYIYLKNGKVNVISGELIKQHTTTNDILKITLPNDSSIFYNINEIDSLGRYPKKLPKFTMFKFNNKYNHNVYVDVFATIGENEITATVPAIGKRLTPSFLLDQPDAYVTVNGVRQTSKVSRHRFDKPIVYTIGYQNYQQLKYVKVVDEVWSEAIPGEPNTEEIPFSMEMLSTNAPSNFNEGLDKLMDKNENTYFHSTWGNGKYQPLPMNQSPFIEIHLKESIDKFVFHYSTSSSHDNRYPYEFVIQASQDGKTWTDMDTINEKQGIPTSELNAHFKSPIIRLNGFYRYFRFKMTRASYKNYLVLAEFSMHKIISESEGIPPHLISPAKYEYLWQPYGKEIPVKVTWPTDHATNVPRIDINVEGGKMITDKVNYLKAAFVVDGGGVFPNMQDSMLIKGRGNISWVGTDKSPYRLKFATSVKPFGLTKGKNWVLLANNQRESMLTNAIGMKIANMAKVPGANQIVPVELYINGNYRGHYNFTQHVGLHNNSIDINETNATLLELDRYYDEDFKFLNEYYDLPTNVKKPDFTEVTPTPRNVTFEMIQSDFNHFSRMVANGSEEYTELMNLPMFARYLLTNELIMNLELKHPKSCFLYKEDLLALHSQYIFGPAWDFDWAYGYEYTHSYCNYDATNDFFAELNGKGGTFFKDIFFGSDRIQRAYYKEWKNFMENNLDEVIEYIDDYYQYARPSIEHNASTWGDGLGYASIANKFKTWLTKRANHIFTTIRVFDLEEQQTIEVGDVNQDGAITIADATCVQNYILNLPNESFNAQQADANKNGKINITDAVWIVALALKEEANEMRHIQLPVANATLRADKFTATLGCESTLPLTFQVDEDGYSATQFDVTLPEGVTFSDVILPTEWQTNTVEYAEIGAQRYRFVVYGSNGTTLPKGTATLRLQVIPTEMITSSERVVSLDAASLVTSTGEDERLSSLSTTFDIQEMTGISNNGNKETIEGGKMLQVESLTNSQVKIYTVDGRLVKSCPVKVGMNFISLPSGVYIVNQKKVVINN